MKLLILLLISVFQYVSLSKNITNECPNDCSSHGSCINGECQCLKGFSAQDCSEYGCLNDCSGHGTCRDPRTDLDKELIAPTCICDEQWNGGADDCSIRTQSIEHTYDECPDDCSGHGFCALGACRCFTSYRGTNCEEQFCDDELTCNGNGECNDDFTCKCKNDWTGETCDTMLCTNEIYIDACGNHGTCIHLSGSNSRPLCLCDDNYTGVLCDALDCSTTGCVHGECVSDSIDSAITSTSCQCKSGFSGIDCSIAHCSSTSDDEGDDLLCSGHGLCVEGGCYCEPTWTGSHCDVPACPYNCNDNGRCLKDGKCHCIDGFTGIACSIPSKDISADTSECVNVIQSSVCVDGCNDRGVCVEREGRCECDLPFFGASCEKEPCDNNCSGNGDCQNDGSCVCNAGFTGTNCSMKGCDNKGCSGHGECVHENASSGACVCDKGWFGNDCANREGCESNCSGNGSCSDGHCICYEGFKGVSCEIKICPNDCGNHGVCLGGECECLQGWFGEQCQKHGCSSSNELQCSGHGVCEAGKCVCLGHFGAPFEHESMFTGEDCSKAMCPGRLEKPQSEHRQNNNNNNNNNISNNNNNTDTFVMCSGHGLCQDNGMCECKQGHISYIGIGCESRSRCPFNCNNNGVCDVDNGVCACSEGYRGIDCSVKTCEWDHKLQISLPGCNEPNGLCRDGKCVCESAFTGAWCDRPASHCINNCNKNGICNSYGVCECYTGFNGVDCGIQGCPNDCSGNGECVETDSSNINKKQQETDKESKLPESSLECLCESGYIGDDCSIERCSTLNVCSNGGTCLSESGKCNCKDGFIGPLCEFVESTVCPNQCSGLGHGSCDTIHGGCRCDIRFTGDDCSKPVDKS